MRSGGWGLPQEVQLTPQLFPWIPLRFLSQCWGPGRGSIRLSRASLGLPEAPGSPVSTAQAHLP